MKETVTVTVRTDSEGVTGSGRGSLSPVLSGFVPIAGGHGVATQDPDDLTGPYIFGLAMGGTCVT